MFTTTSRPLVLSKRPGSTESNLNTNNKIQLETGTKSLSLQLRYACIQVHVPAWQFVYRIWRQSEFNWQSVEINTNEERFTESRVVITHTIGFDSTGMWLIFPCLYHHSISVGTVMCMLDNTGDWPRYWIQPFCPQTASHDSLSPDSIYLPDCLWQKSRRSELGCAAKNSKKWH